MRLSCTIANINCFILDMWIIYIVRVTLFTIVIFIVEIIEEDLPCPIEAIDNGLKSEMVI